MTPADLDLSAAAVLSWLLTYAVRSTILLAAAAVAAWRFADRHEWVDLIWKAALIGPLVTASLPLDAMTVPLGGRWAVSSVATVSRGQIMAPAPSAVDETRTRATTATPVTPPVVDRFAEFDKSGPTAAGRSTVARAMVRRWPTVAAVSWLLIAIVAVARYGIRLRGVYRALGSGLPVTAANLIDTLDGLQSSANQSRAIRLTTSPMCPVPLALAGRRIVLPDRFLWELDSEQQRAALAHELAHLAAGADIQAQRRLIQEDDLRVGDEAAHDIHLLAQAGGQVGRLGVGAVAQPDDGQQVVDALVGGLVVQAVELA
jgi:beta-lactamase regulating signal transducer with metallopeptidase domain